MVISGFRFNISESSGTVTTREDTSSDYSGDERREREDMSWADREALLKSEKKVGVRSPDAAQTRPVIHLISARHLSKVLIIHYTYTVVDHLRHQV